MGMFNKGYVEGVLAEKPEIVEWKGGSHFVKFSIVTPHVADESDRGSGQAVEISVFCGRGTDISEYWAMPEGAHVSCDYWIESREGDTRSFNVLCAHEVREIASPAALPAADFPEDQYDEDICDSYDDCYQEYSRYHSSSDSYDYDPYDSFDFMPVDELVDAARGDSVARAYLSNAHGITLPLYDDIGV